MTKTSRTNQLELLQRCGPACLLERAFIVLAHLIVWVIPWAAVLVQLGMTRPLLGYSEQGQYMLAATFVVGVDLLRAMPERSSAPLGLRFKVACFAAGALICAALMMDIARPPERLWIHGIDAKADSAHARPQADRLSGIYNRLQ